MRAVQDVRGVVVGLGCMCVLLQGGLRAQPVPEWSRANSGARRAIINEVAKRTDSASSRTFLFVIEEASYDPDAQVRMAAMAAVSGRFGALRFRATPDVESRRAADATIEVPTRDVVRRLATRDVDGRVRREAVRALINMDASVGDAPNGVRVSTDTATTLGSVYRADSDLGVRVEVVKAFALLEDGGPEAARIVSEALQSDMPDLLVYGLLGAPKRHLGAGVSRAGALLAHSDRRVRLAAVAALQQYGATARSELGRVEEAMGFETDAAVLESLRALVLSLQAGK